MNEYFKIAWRNIWRKKFRTLLTAGVAFMAVFLSILMTGFQLGVWNNIIEAIVHSYSGYIQIHAKGYWDDKTFDYSMSFDRSFQNQIEATEHVRKVIPRIESFALASAGLKTKGVIVYGIDPEKEDAMTKLSLKIAKGHFLHTDDHSVMISGRLSEFLNLSVGDTLVLIGQGYQGNSANGLFPVKAIIRLPSPEFDNKMVYMTLSAAQDFYSAQGRISSLVIDIDKSMNMKSVATAISDKTDQKKYEVMDWTEMMKELYQQYIFKKASEIVILFILYLIVGFIAFGTVMMMTNERRREFAIMVAIGMRKKSLSVLVGIELCYIMILGLLSGIAGSIPILYYFHLNPIRVTGETATAYAAFGIDPVFPILWQPGYIINQGIVVFILIIISSLYPLWNISRLDVSRSIKS